MSRSSLPLQIAITGGIGSGKSYVKNVFESLGVPCYHADERANELVESDPEIKKDLISLLGKDVYLNNGKYNRELVANKVFKEGFDITKINDIIHPAVRKDYTLWLSEQSTPYIIKESALVFEIGAESEYDKIILVTASEETRINRIQKRDPQRSLDQIRTIIDKQLPDSEKSAKADYIIENDDNTPILNSIIQIHQSITKDNPNE